MFVLIFQELFTPLFVRTHTRNSSEELIVIVGKLPSFIESEMITPYWNRPTKWFKEFVEDINCRDPRIVFGLQILPGPDKNGNIVDPRHPEVYLYGLPRL